ncbi:MAG: CoA-binding protein [Deltaproteobacteria bacterium]|nr:CoA-binding protein [Deltaproteobacteria bacterium]
MSKDTPLNLNDLFYPKSLAVVGASPKRGYLNRWGGNTFIEGAINLNFPGNIYPVNPKAESILGLKAYKSVRDIPGEIDLVIFSIPFSAVLPVMEDCVAKKVKFVHLFTAGFSETGRPELAEIERKLIALAREGGIRVVGPNCMGLYCPEGGLAWTNEFPRTPGTIGFVSQSGQLAGHFVQEGGDQRLRFSKVVSFGNAADLKAHDFLEYLAGDDKTDIIGAYIEGLKDGRAFFEVARKITQKKPMVVFKGGQTEGGARATQSHTGSLAGSMGIWQALCRQTGIISVNSLEELIATIGGLQRLPLPTGLNVAILGGAGGGSVTMTDLAEKEGLKVPHLTEKTIRALEELVPVQGNSAKNPLDIMGALFGGGEKIYGRLIELLRDDPNIDALIFSQNIDMFFRRIARSFLDDFIRMTVNSMHQLGKPLYLVLGKARSLEGEALRQDVETRYHHYKMATFSSFTMAARVYHNMKIYGDFLSAHNIPIPVFPQTP